MKHWIAAFRLRTLPLALSSIGMGGFLAYSLDVFNSTVFTWCILTTLFLQILSNLANDYGDTIHGADGAHREGPQREVQAGNITQKQMMGAIIIFILLSLASGLYLLYISNISLKVFLVFLGLGLISIFGAILYTNGKLPYGYIGLGDLSVFTFFGIIAVLGSFYLQAGYLESGIVLPAISCGLLTVAVLNINNIRDIKSDLVAGKKSIPARIGRERAVIYHFTLLIVGMLTAIIYVLINYTGPQQFLFLLVIPLLIINARAVQTKTSAQELDPYLKQMALTTLLFVLSFGFSII